MSKRKTGSNSALQQRKRRQWITFVRMVRYGINNFSRNAWLTIAATAVMTITLLLIFMTLAARNTLASTATEISNKVDMSIYLEHDVTKEQVDPILGDLSKLSSVKEVAYVSPEAQRTDAAKVHSDDPDYLAALNQADNRFPGVIRVKVKDINDTSQLKDFVDTNQNLKPYLSTTRPPSFNSNSVAIKTIGSWIDFADRAGIVGTIVFIAISSLIVFNTIRMAIFNRREEIQMMKLIGADRNFIRGPFVVEAVVYGFIAAVIATGLGFLALYSFKDKLIEKGVAIQSTIDGITTYVGFVLLGMILAGALIGVGSSLLATRRYLKI